MTHPSLSRCRPRTSLGFLTVSLLLLGPLACGEGGGGGGGSTPPPNPQAALTPLSANVVAGQTQQYTSTAPAGTTVTWSVAPAAGGTLTASGLFTAGTVVGTYTITGAWTWTNGSPATASTSVYVVAAPQSPLVNPNTVAAAGGAQKGANGLENLTVIGEDLDHKTSTNTSGTLQNRTGLDPAATPTGQ